MAEPILVQCPHCDSQMKIRNAAIIGKKAPCPKCGERFLVQPTAGDDEFDFGATNEDYGEDEYAVDDGGGSDDIPSTPRLKRSGSSKSKSSSKSKKRKRQSDWQRPAMMGGTILAALLVIAGLFWGVMKLFKGRPMGGPAPDLAWLPNDTQTLMQIRVADVMASSVMQKVLQDPAVAAALQKSTQETGFDLSNIERMSVSVPDMGSAPRAMGMMQPQNFSGVIILKSSVDASTWLSKLQQNPASPVESSEHASRTIHSVVRDGTRMGFSFIDGKTIVFGSEPELKKALDTGGQCGAAPRFSWVDGSSQILFVTAPSDPSVLDRSGAMFMMMNRPVGGSPQKRPSEEMSGMFGALNFSSDIEGIFGAKMNEAALARSTASTMQQEIRKGADEIAKTRKQAQGGFNPMTMMLGAGADGLLSRVEKALRGARGQSSGNVCQVSINLDGQIVDEAKSLISMAATMNAMKGPGGGSPLMPSPGPSGFGGSPPAVPVEQEAVAPAESPGN